MRKTCDEPKDCAKSGAYAASGVYAESGIYAEREWRGLSPAAFALGLLFATVTLAFRFHVYFNLLIFFVSQAALLLRKKRPRARLYLPLLALQLLLGTSLFFTGYYYHRPEGLGLSQFYWENTAWWNGLQLSSRALAFGGLGIFFALTAEGTALIQSFEQQLKLPRTLAYGVLAAWSILPKMKQEYDKVRMALRARGLEVSPFSPKVLKLMLVKAVRWSDHLAMAMLSKGFSEHGDITHWRLFRWHFYDFLFIFGLPLFFALVLFFWK